MDRLAKDGIFAPNMTLEQVKLAAKVWAKKMATGIPPQIMKPKRKTSAGVLRTLWRICANECEFGKLKSGTDKAIRSLHTKLPVLLAVKNQVTSRLGITGS